MTEPVAFVLLVAACTAWMCGHQGATAWPRRKAQAPASRPRTRSPDSRATHTHPSPAHGRTAIWAYTQPITYQEHQ
ncbi:hypothetical protein [Streptomyces flaveolus]|uniref:hypothetical protein n=1 Tax=Streptomyces flaveolus TaxID=67297 RepID=UPI001670F79E|nr:hypothetical protein [Streptomyces flaveolus]GGQ83565.1 hypothetical protein GCM10010216_51750 [Streptomyces flaveolus]